MSREITREELDRITEKGDRLYKDFVEGTKYIYPQNRNKWLNFVHKSYNGFFEGKEVKDLVELLKRLAENQSFNDVKKYVEDRFDDGAMYYHSMKCALVFGKRGPEFYSYTFPDMDKETKKFVEEIKEQNEDFKYELGIDSESMERAL